MNTIEKNGGRKRIDIVVAEDDPVTMKLVSKWLREGGYTVRQANDGEEGLKLIKKQCPDILLTDWQMPRMTGIELCQAVREAHLTDSMYVLFLTANGSPENIQEAMAAGADDFLTKPTDGNQLLARVRKIEWAILRREEKARLAETDSLTGSLNRSSFNKHCVQEAKRAKRHNTPLSCVILDIDLFKAINDNYGHPVGDEALKMVADTLSNSSRDTDYVCRYGGDEFCVLLPDTDEHGATMWADRVRQSIFCNPVFAGDKEIHLKVTIGVAQWRMDMESAGELIDYADQALRMAKQTGRDRTQSYSMMSKHDLMESVHKTLNCKRLSQVQCREVMNTPILCLKADDSIKTAAALFLRIRINSAPVVDHHGQLVGILSEQDILGVALAGEVWDWPVSDVMKTDVVCYEEETPALTIWEFLRRVNMRRVVIVKDNQPTGVISRGGLLRWLGNWGMTLSKVDANNCSEEALRALDHIEHKTRMILDEIGHAKKESRLSLEYMAPCIITTVTQIQQQLDDIMAIFQPEYQFQPDREKGDSHRSEQCMTIAGPG